MRHFLALTILCLLTVPVGATTYYVSTSGNGTKSGADWNNTCNQFTGSCAMSCGNTYYVQGGSSTQYSAISPSACSSGSPLLIKGATVADHGTSTGWSASKSVGNGDGGSQALWSCCLNFDSYQTWDGNYVQGGLWDGTAADYGFNIVTPGPGICSTNHNFVGVGTGTTHASMAHFSAAGCGASYDTGDTGVDFGGYVSSSTYNSNNTLSSSYLTNFGTCFTIAMANSDIAQYNYCNGNWGSSNNHGDLAVVANGTSTGGNIIRYNRLANNNGPSQTGVLVLIGPGNVGVAPCVGYKVQIYGNQLEASSGGNGVFVTGGDNQSFCNSTIVNNTVVTSGQFAWLCEGGGSGCGVEGNNVVENNLMWNTSGSIEIDSGGGTDTVDYNACFSCTVAMASETHGQSVSGNPFVNSSVSNYQLANAPGTNCSSTTTVCAGTDVSSIVSVDAAGNPYGSNGNWERGAFAFVDPGSQPNPPQGLTAVVH